MAKQRKFEVQMATASGAKTEIKFNKVVRQALGKKLAKAESKARVAAFDNTESKPERKPRHDKPRLQGLDA